MVLQIIKTSNIIGLRITMENIINDTWKNLDNNIKPKVEENIADYRLFRTKLIEAGVHRNDIECYDDSFKNLPWEDYGYKIPQIK